MSRSVSDRIRDVRAVVDAARRIAHGASRDTLDEAIAASTGLSISGVALAFARHLELDPTDDELAALVTRAGDAPRVVVVLSANVFVGALRAIAVARAASRDVVVRPSRRDPAFAEALVRMLDDPEVVLASDVAIDELTEGEVHVYGRDETIAEVRRKARPGVRVWGHGAGMGVAWVSAAADVEDAARGLAEDVVAFDQRGCLSPRVACVAARHADVFAEALHVALEEQGTLVRRGQVPSEERAEAGRYVATMTYAARALVGRDHAVGSAPVGAPLVIPPAYRNVHVAACATLEDARRLLAPVAASITSVGSDDLEAARVLAPHARASALGAMQRPRLDGPVDLRPAVAVTAAVALDA